MEYTKLKNINEYISESVSPMKTPEQIFEMYSVPIYDTGHPEYLHGSEIASNKVKVKKQDILLCKINPRINRVWVVTDESEYPCIASSEWIVIRNSKYNPEFLAWYFRSPKFKQLMTSEVTGIGGSLTRAQPRVVAEYPVPVLKRQEQDVITNILNRVNEIIDTKKQELQKLDELVKARFVEMFYGKGYKTNKLKDLCNKITDGTHKTPEYQESGVTFISAKNVVDGKLNLDDVKYITEEEYEEIQRRCQTEYGDVLLTKSGTLGLATVVSTHEKLGLFESLAVLKYDRIKLNGDFLCGEINSPFVQEQLRRCIKGVAVKHLHLNVIGNVDIIVPPMRIQNQYADFVQQVDKSKLAIEKSLEEMQLLFDSLMQKYFG